MSLYSAGAQTALTALTLASPSIAGIESFAGTIAKLFPLLLLSFLPAVILPYLLDGVTTPVHRIVFCFGQLLALAAMLLILNSLGYWSDFVISIPIVNVAFHSTHIIVLGFVAAFVLLGMLCLRHWHTASRDNYTVVDEREAVQRAIERVNAIIATLQGTPGARSDTCVGTDNALIQLQSAHQTLIDMLATTPPGTPFKTAQIEQFNAIVHMLNGYLRFHEPYVEALNRSNDGSTIAGDSRPGLPRPLRSRAVARDWDAPEEDDMTDLLIPLLMVQQFGSTLERDGVEYECASGAKPERVQSSPPHESSPLESGWSDGASGSDSACDSSSSSGGDDE